MTCKDCFYSKEGRNMKNEKDSKYNKCFVNPEPVTIGKREKPCRFYIHFERFK